MTNHGVQEAFRALINEIHACNILNKEFMDEEKKRGGVDLVLNDEYSILPKSGVVRE